MDESVPARSAASPTANRIKLQSTNQTRRGHGGPGHDQLRASARRTGTFLVSSLRSRSGLLPKPSDGGGTAERDIPAPQGEFLPAAENSSCCPGVGDGVCVWWWGVMSIQTAGAVRAPFLLPTPRPHVHHTQKKKESGRGRGLKLTAPPPLAVFPTMTW